MKKLIVPSFCFAVLSTAALQQTVFADTASTTNETKYVHVDATSNLSLRKSPSTNAAIVAKLTNGTEVTMDALSKGWAHIKVGAKEGYVSEKYLETKSLTKDTPTNTKYVNVSTGMLNLRKTASSSAPILTKLNKYTALTVLSESNGWSKVQTNGKTGYVASQYLSTKNNATKKTTVSSTTSEKASSAPVTKYVNLASGTLNFRKSPSTNGTVLMNLKAKSAVIVYSENNGWAKVEAGGKTGYVSTTYLTTKAPAISNTKSTTTTSKTSSTKTSTKYVSVNAGSSLNVRKSASTSSAVLTTIKNNTAVKVNSESNGWAKIEVGGKTGYVSTTYLTTSAPTRSTTSAPKPTSTKTTTKYVAVDVGSSLNVRKSASTSSAVLTTIKNNTAVKVDSESNGWAKIEVGGKTGYVSTTYLTTKAPTKVSSTSKTEVTTIQYINSATVAGLNLYSKPSAFSSVIVKLANRVQVNVLSEENGWAKIKVYNTTGYVQTDVLSLTKPTSSAENENKDSTVTKFVSVDAGSNLNMRSNPSPSASIVTRLKNDTVVTVYSESNGWAKVTANGKTGYVSTAFLKSKQPENTDNQSKSINKVYNLYDISLDDFTSLEMATKPQTDNNYTTYIREDALTLTGSHTGVVHGNGWKVRGGAGTSYREIETVSNGQTLQILSKVKSTDGYYWYAVDLSNSWKNASSDDVKYYIDSTNFADNPVSSFQFLKLSQPTSVSSTEVNSRILSGKGILSGKASAFIKAGNTYGINEIYLISHALLETGNGTSTLANGVKVNGQTVYNMYGIGAYDADPVNSGAKYAYNAGWFTPEAAIIGGAKFIATDYIHNGQDTLYKMRWNPLGVLTYGYATHQYASDIAWANKQVNQIYNLYSLLSSYHLTLDIPKYNQ